MTDEWILIDCIDQGSCSYSINKSTLEIKNNKTNRILNGCIDKKGYRVIELNNKKYLYHRIIAQMFISNPDNLPEIDHRNHNRSDNRIENLRWTTRHCNMMNTTKCHTKELNLINSLPADIVPLKYNDIIYENFYYSKSLDCVCMQRICDVICYKWCNTNGTIYTKIRISASERKYIGKKKLLRELQLE